jgi:hypothetical protein
VFVDVVFVERDLEPWLAVTRLSILRGAWSGLVLRFLTDEATTECDRIATSIVVTAVLTKISLERRLTSPFYFDGTLTALIPRILGTDWLPSIFRSTHRYVSCLLVIVPASE